MNAFCNFSVAEASAFRIDTDSAVMRAISSADDDACSLAAASISFIFESLFPRSKSSCAQRGTLTSILTDEMKLLPAALCSALAQQQLLMQPLQRLQQPNHWCSVHDRFAQMLRLLLHGQGLWTTPSRSYAEAVVDEKAAVATLEYKLRHRLQQRLIYFRDK